VEIERRTILIRSLDRLAAYSLEELGAQGAEAVAAQAS
jgi:hypothetical protein